MYFNFRNRFLIKTNKHHCKDAHVACDNCRVESYCDENAVACQTHYSIIIARTNVKPLSILSSSKQIA